MKTFLTLVSLFFCQLFYSEAARAQDWPQDWPALKYYEDKNNSLKSNVDSKVKVVYIGDSITQNWGDASPEFFENNHYLDRGISGQTSPQILLRFRADAIDLKPKIIVLLCGTNDIAGNTGPSTPEMTEDNIMSMTELAQVNHIKIILCSIPPANKFSWKPDVEPADKIIALNQWIKDYAKKKRIPYVDYYSSMADDYKGMKREYSGDGVHPNEAGYAVMEKLVQKVIHKML